VAARTVVVALIVLAVAIAAVVRVALPAYRRFTIREQVVEGVELARAHQAAVITAWESSGHEFGDIYSGAIDSVPEEQSRYVKSLDVVAGAIVITYGGASDSALRGHTLTIVPALDTARQSVAWQCGRGPAPDGFDSIFDEPSRLTDVPDDYLPSACRGRRPPRPHKRKGRQP
jgi:Tfp pilus assembly major pilin PilA